MLMRSKVKSEIRPIDWIDPAALSDSSFSVARQGDLEILIRLLDLSAFPTVEELQHQIREQERAQADMSWFTRWFAKSVANAKNQAA